MKTIKMVVAVVLSLVSIYFINSNNSSYGLSGLMLLVQAGAMLLLVNSYLEAKDGEKTPEQYIKAIAEMRNHFTVLIASLIVTAIL